MDISITPCQHSPEEYTAIASLLIQAFIEEGHTDRSNAAMLTAPTELQKRGEIFLARSNAPSGGILGMVILVRPSSPARQVAEPREAEVHLLAVDPSARGRGIAARLMEICEERASAQGYRYMALSTQPEMTSAHKVYERMGY